MTECWNATGTYDSARRFRLLPGAAIGPLDDEQPPWANHTSYGSASRF
jgi:hypothetical protein